MSEPRTVIDPSIAVIIHGFDADLPTGYVVWIADGPPEEDSTESYESGFGLYPDDPEGVTIPVGDGLSDAMWKFGTLAGLRLPSESARGYGE